MMRMALYFSAALLFFSGLIWLEKYEQQIGYDKAAAIYQARLIKAIHAAQETERVLKTKIEDEKYEAKNREDRNRAAAVSAANSIAKLRDTLRNISGGLPTDTASSCRIEIDSISEVFGQCLDRYREVAEAADGHASDVTLLLQSWPDSVVKQ